MLNILKEWCDAGVIRQLDYQFGRFISSLEEEQGELVGFIAALASHELGRGHICLELGGLDLSEKLGLYGESAERLQAKLNSSGWQLALEKARCTGDGSTATPLVLQDDRLYLHRYWQYESALSEHLRNLASPVELGSAQFAEMQQLLSQLFAPQYGFLFHALKAQTGSNQVQRQQLVCDMLDVVFPDSLDWQAIDQVLTGARTSADLEALSGLIPLSASLNWQKVAAATALTRRFAVISGGPGTGKTTTVTKLLAALVKQAGEEAPVIRLVAPTGKAAARLTESIGAAIDQLPVEPELRDAIPRTAGTIHRLLGAVAGSAEFRHNRSNPLHLDVLVVDEASMVDLPMMYKLTQALPPHARLILLGDKDQLASVEAGAVLGDICSFLSMGYSQVHSQQLSGLTGYQWLEQHAATHNAPLADCLCMLQKSYRFDARSGIGQLAKAVNAGDPSRLAAVWNQGFEDIALHPMSAESYRAMIAMAREGYRSCLETIHGGKTDEVLARKALSEFARCRVLCALREGEFGIAGLNQRIEQSLKRANLIPKTEEMWYAGRPVMVTRNDPGLGLFNGDIGLCLLDESGDEPRLRVYFELPDGTLKSVLPSRVPQHETAWAMTIHKSQGSEFEHTIMVLPVDFSPLLTRELIYTGLTRAKKRLDLFCSETVLNRGVKIRTRRSSGLAEKLG